MRHARTSEERGRLADTGDRVARARWRCVVRSTVRGSQGRPRRARVYVCAVQGNFSDSVPVLPPTPDSAPETADARAECESTTRYY